MELVPPFYQILWVPLNVAGVYVASYVIKEFIVPEIKICFWSALLPGWCDDYRL